MQQSNTSNKKRKATEGASAAVGVNAAAEKPAQKRVARTSKSKSDSPEKSTTARETKQDAVVAQELAPVVTVSEPVVSEALSGVNPEIAVPVASAETVEFFRVESVNPDVSTDDIARLAHSFWEARGYQHGHAEEDWFRAERQLKKSFAAHA